MPGVDVVHDLRVGPWPWKDQSVDEVHSSHFLEHLTNLDGKWERVTFWNELYRILKDGAKATIVFPHWCSSRYYGDPTHKEPFSEFGFYYLDREWRAQNAPHSDIQWNPHGYSCHLNVTWGYSMHQPLSLRNADYQQFAMQYYKEACQDIIATASRK